MLSRRFSTMATGSTQGAFRLLSSRRMAYSRVANSSTVSLTAKTSLSPGPVLIRRTMCRDIPRMLVKPGSSGQSSSDLRQGRAERASMSSLRPVIRSSLIGVSSRIIKLWRSRNPGCPSILSPLSLPRPQNPLESREPPSITATPSTSAS